MLQSWSVNSGHFFFRCAIGSTSSSSSPASIEAALLRSSSAIYFCRRFLLRAFSYAQNLRRGYRWALHWRMRTKSNPLLVCWKRTRALLASVALILLDICQLVMLALARSSAVCQSTTSFRVMSFFMSYDCKVPRFFFILTFSIAFSISSSTN